MKEVRIKGFTLAEAMFSILITILVLAILKNLLFSMQKFNSAQNQHVNNVAYAYVQLERFMHEDAKLVYPVLSSAGRNKTAFAKINKNNEKEAYYVEYYAAKQVLKVSKAGVSSGGGYMPLIFNIEKANFKTKKDQIIIQVYEKNKGRSDLVFKLDEKPEEENVTKKKDKRERVA